MPSSTQMTEYDTHDNLRFQDFDSIYINPSFPVRRPLHIHSMSFPESPLLGEEYCLRLSAILGCQSRNMSPPPFS